MFLARRLAERIQYWRRAPCYGVVEARLWDNVSVYAAVSSVIRSHFTLLDLHPVSFRSLLIYLSFNENFIGFLLPRLIRGTAIKPPVLLLRCNKLNRLYYLQQDHENKDIQVRSLHLNFAFGFLDSPSFNKT